MTNAVLDAIESRRTTNIFDSSRDIGDEQISELVRLATRAPTSFHLQNWRFVAVRTPEAKARLRKLAFDQPKVPVVLVTVGYAADGNWPQKPRRPVTELLSFL